MKVAIDISPLKSAHRFRGIGAYTKNLIRALKQHSAADFRVELIEEGSVPEDVDLVHYPYFDLFWLSLPLRKVKKTVVTIHDLTPLVFPDKFPSGIKGKIRFQIQKFSLRRVEAVICDSKNSQKDIVKYLNFPKNKIHVVYLAPGKKFKKLEIALALSSGRRENWKLKIARKYSLPNGFILYVGDVNYNKNVEGLIRAFYKLKSPRQGEGRQTSKFKTTTKNLNLVLVGEAFLHKDLKETKEILQLIKELGLVNKTKILGYVPDEDLVALYNLATAYCQPSFYEGFGLPVLEAMACGTPVVASKKSSLPEIVGKAAILVDPYDINDIANGLTVAMENKDLREDLIQRGLRQAKKFSWEKTARENYEIYQKVVGEK